MNSPQAANPKVESVTMSEPVISTRTNISSGLLLKGSVWTAGAYGLGQVVRLLTNIILAHLLAPQLFGIMLIVYSLRTGITLFSDFGVGQNIIYSKNADNPDFYNTAWTLEIIRNLVLWLICLVAAVPVARFYQAPILISVLPIAALDLVLTALTSSSVYLLRKRLQVAKLNAFEAVVALISSAATVVLAYLDPTIWALVFGNLFGSTVSMIGSHFLLGDVKQKLLIYKSYAWQIFDFGKWIFLSSVAYFLAMNFDRLYLAKVIPLEVLGVYGIARSIVDVLGALISRLGNYVLFPFVASHSHLPRRDLRAQVVVIRAKFLLLLAAGVSLLVVLSDLAIRILYDARYRAAAWMLPVLLVGSWFSILATVNESTLLGLGKPSYSAISNGTKFGSLLVGLPLIVTRGGILGCVALVAVSDLFRYFPMLIGQKREKFSFGGQDFLITVAMFLLIGLWEWLRWIGGLGSSFETLPI